jgi:hypothetical protein
MMPLKPYEEMNTLEVIQYWKRVRYAHLLNLYESPNHVLWAVVDETHSETLRMWDVNTGVVVNPAAPPVKAGVCIHCGHPIQWEKVAVPPRWEHVRTMSNDSLSRLFWICECGCMTPEPKETMP